MSHPRTSLNIAIDWARLLDVLGLSVSQSAILPGVGKCPNCQGNYLMILQDRASGGQWHWCRKCHIRGDMVELAARVWGLTIQGAIGRLRRENFEISNEHSDVKDYIEASVSYRHRMWSMWEKARNNMTRHTAVVGSLLQKMGIRALTESSWWEQTTGKLIGCMPALEVEKMMRPNSLVSHPSKTWQKDTTRAVFKGTKWEEVLVFPLFDLPYRIRAFLFVGREADPEKDFVLRHTQLETVGGRSWVDRRCLGVYFHPSVLTTSEENVFVFNDLKIAYKMQHQHFRLSTQPLPVAAYPNRQTHWPRDVWEIFGNRQLIFWAPFDLSKVLSHAIDTDGLISTTGPVTSEPRQVADYLERQSPVELLRTIKNSASTWQKALTKFVLEHEDTEIHELASSLQVTEIDLATVAGQLPRRAREKLRGLLSRKLKIRSVTMEQKQVIEKPSGWYLSTSRMPDELLVNAHIRIDQVVQHKKLQEAYYCGRVIWQNEELPFTAPKRVFDRNPFAWVEQFLLEAGKGLLQYSKSWSRRAVLIATQFHQPKFVIGVDCVGYNKDENRFSLPNFDVKAGGEVIERQVSLAAGLLPASALEKPEVISPQELDDISDPTCWAVITSVLANILAPVYEEDTFGIGLLGVGADTVGKVVGDALGCLQYNVSRRPVMEAARNVVAVHNWPIVIETAPAARRKTTNEWVDPDRNASPHNCIMLLDWYIFHAKLLLGDWHLVRQPLQLTFKDTMGVAIRKMVPAYLQDFMSRDAVIESSEESWWDKVQHDLVGFVRRHHGNLQALLEAKNYYPLQGIDSQAAAFADLVGELIQTGQFVIVPEGFEDAKKPSLLTIENVMGSAGLFVPKIDVIQAFQKKSVSLFEASRVTKILADAGVLLEDRNDGWVVNQEWWTGRQRLRTAEESGMLKLHTG